MQRSQVDWIGVLVGLVIFAEVPKEKAPMLDKKSPPFEEKSSQPLKSDEVQHPSPEGIGPIPEEIDPELVSLDAPRRKRRHPIISFLVIGLSVYMIYFTRAEFSFFLNSRAPINLGEADEAVKKGTLKTNTYVKLHGAPD